MENSRGVLETRMTSGLGSTAILDCPKHTILTPQHYDRFRFIRAVQGMPHEGISQRQFIHVVHALSIFSWQARIVGVLHLIHNIERRTTNGLVGGPTCSQQTSFLEAGTSTIHPRSDVHVLRPCELLIYIFVQFAVSLPYCAKVYLLNTL